MEYVLTPYNYSYQPFVWWESGFSEEELNWLQQKARSPLMKAKVGGGDDGVVDPNIRRSDLNWLNNNHETSWVFHKLGSIVSSLNAQFFRFDLTGFGEQLQLTNYDEKEKGMYGWHIDMGGNTSAPCRKLSLVLQLSDPVDYEGGVLELKPFGENIIKVKKQRGLVVCFPSWTLHQVTPVTSGNRQTLVAWISGPPFK